MGKALTFPIPFLLLCIRAVTITITTAVSLFQIQLLSVPAGSSVSTTGVYGPPESTTDELIVGFRTDREGR